MHELYDNLAYLRKQEYGLAGEQAERENGLKS